MRVSPLAAALLLAACTPAPPPGAAPAHAPRVLNVLDEARIYRALFEDESNPRPRLGLSRHRILGYDLGDGGLLPESIVSQLLDWGVFSAECEDGERSGAAPECTSRDIHPLSFSKPVRVNRDTVDVYVTGGRRITMNIEITRYRLVYAAGRWTRMEESETRVLI